MKNKYIIFAVLMIIAIFSSSCSETTQFQPDFEKETTEQTVTDIPYEAEYDPFEKIRQSDEKWLEYGSIDKNELKNQLAELTEAKQKLYNENAELLQKLKLCVEKIEEYQKDEQFLKAEQVCSNSQLYKQAGNSIVVNVMEEIFKNLMEIE